MNETLYETIIQITNETTKSAFVILDQAGHIQEIRTMQQAERKLATLYNQPFQKLLNKFFSTETKTLICQAFQECILHHQDKELCKIPLNTLNGQNEYFYLRFTPVLKNGSIIAFIKNITEPTLIEEEFNTLCEQTSEANQDLHSAMFKLDLQYMELEQAYKKLSALYKITSVVQKTVSLSDLLTEMLDSLIHELGYQNAAIFLYDDSTASLAIKAHRGYRDDIVIPLSQGITGYAASSRKFVHVPDVRNDDRYLPGSPDGFSELAIPLIVDDNLIGVFDVETPEGHPIKDYDISLLLSLSTQLALTIAHATYVTKVQLAANTDSLTRLYNHRYFKSVLDHEYKRAMRYNQPLALLMIDIDNYKLYNDQYGHPRGDEVLIEVANIIKFTAREVDIVARYGGEEFSVLCPETTAEEASIIAERIRYNIECYPFPNRETQPLGAVTVSIGVAGFPRDSAGSEDLIDHADQALYISKRTAKNCVHIFPL